MGIGEGALRLARTDLFRRWLEGTLLRLAG